jgi:2-oxoacid:acceptor oxidoreductase delta subunit (pyruvate/2-ketoisovalerate family)
VGIDIEGYMNLLREGNTREAIDLLLRENPLPAVTGRVCYRPCENVCNRKEFDEAVSIHAVERALGDMALENPPPLQKRDHRPEKIAVVGSGPAGLACAYHLTWLGYKVTVFERDPEPGGILRYGIPEYRLPKEILAREIDRIRDLGVEFQCDKQLGKNLAWKALDEFDAAFLAIGVHRSKPLGLDTEGVTGILPGLQFLHEVNAGRPPALGKQVVVVGGGNTAMDCARTALRLGAEPVVLYRRSREEMPANEEEVDDAMSEGIPFEFLAAPVALRTVEAEEENALESIRAMFNPGIDTKPLLKVTGLECVRMKLGEPDESGRRRPVPIEGSNFFVPAQNVLTAIGEDPEFDTMPAQVTHDKWIVKVDPLGETSRVDFFAGGDIIDEPHTVAFALGSGKRAALGMDRHLRVRSGEVNQDVDVESLRLGGGEDNVSMTRWKDDDPVHRTAPVNEVVTYEMLNINHFTHLPRLEDRFLDPDQRKRSFAEVNLGLDQKDGIAEAGRCFNCGVCNSCELCLIYCPDVAIKRRSDNGKFEIDYDYCKGCGVCSAECPRCAISMTREGL